MASLHAPTRRELLLGTGVLFSWAFLPKIALSEGRDPRFLVIVLRGALDGLAAVPPLGDPNWTRLRGDFTDGTMPALTLNNFFALNPSMPNLYRMYKAGSAIIVHAVATPYRERSHFDGQDVLESGYPAPSGFDSGWLNRALGTLAPADVGANRSQPAFAVGPVAPLIVRGPAQILTWSPPSLPDASDDTLMRLLDLYRHTDSNLARVLEERVGLAAIVGVKRPNTAGRAPSDKASVARIRNFFSNSAAAAAKFMSRVDGPRVGALALDGWDTHASEGPVDGRLGHLLTALDDAMGAFEAGMGPAWKETVVAVVTEFGRTVHVNGTRGTDHGTATAAFLVGGALKGGRVIADWPGLGDSQLLDGRDLKPTTDLRSILKGLLKDHLRVTDRALVDTVFPGSATIAPAQGLIA